MLFGAHESVAGGLHMALERAQKDGCRALQIFTKNSNMWREPILEPDQRAAFRAAHAERFDRGPVMAHTSYLINPCADDREVLAKSKDALVAEIDRCSELGVEYCVLHPGAHCGLGDDAGIARIVESLSEVLDRTRGASARVLLENTAGQGTCIGHRFEHLGRILRETPDAASRMGVCFDTQHAFAAGYDLSTKDGYARTFADLDRTVGLANLFAFHLNDSKKPLGSRVDRHEHVGEGLLGTITFWRLANDPRFARLPGVVETEPRSPETPYKDDVALLARLVGAPAPPENDHSFKLELVPEAPAPKRKNRR